MIFASPSVRLLITMREAQLPVCTSLTRDTVTVFVPYPADVKQPGTFGNTALALSSEAFRTVLTPGAPGAGGGVGATAGFTAPPSTCAAVRTVVRIVAAERGFSQARNRSSVVGEIDSATQLVAQTWCRLSGSQPPFCSARVTRFCRFASVQLDSTSSAVRIAYGSAGGTVSAVGQSEQLNGERRSPTERAALYPHC
jgi:hypothetical protein